MAILTNLKYRIDNAGTQKELDILRKEIMGDDTAGSKQSSAEFKVLEKHQGLISNVFIKTKSHQVLEKLFADKEATFTRSDIHSNLPGHKS